MEITPMLLGAMVLQASAIPAKSGIAIGVGLAAIGAGMAERSIGAAAIGAIAEDDDMLVYGILLTVIPETLVIFALALNFV